MKKTLVIFFLLLSNNSYASLKYECSRYINDNYQGYTYVFAKNKDEAEKIALIKFRNKLGKTVDYVKCK